MGQILDHKSFIRAHTVLLPVPHTPEISLYLAHEATELWQKTEDELGEIGLPPPFWAFAWAGGQALARYILDHPEHVRGKRVLDLASGSGLVAIAAMMAGALEVYANDIDAFSFAAIELNAEANGVCVKPVAGNLMDHSEGSIAENRIDNLSFDCILAGDIAYEVTMAQTMFSWLHRHAEQGSAVFVGDPGRAYLPRQGLECLVEYQVPVTRMLEDSEIKRTRVWRVISK